MQWRANYNNLAKRSILRASKKVNLEKVISKRETVCCLEAFKTLR